MSEARPATAARAGATAWTDLEEIRRRLRKAWDSGRLPAAVLRSGPLALAAPIAGSRRGEPGEAADEIADDASGDSGAALAFPLRVALRGPSSAELGERFAESRAWIASLRDAEGRPGFELEWRAVEHRQLGRNVVPVAAVFATPVDAAALIGKRRDAARLAELAASVAAAFPALGPWILRRPLELLERGDEWPALLGVLSWFRDHPRSGRYLRQVDAPGAHTKFVEARRGLISELLDLVLDPGAVDEAASGAAGFARRYGLCEKPALVRFRSLDPGLALSAGLGTAEASPRPLSVAELCLRAQDFARLFGPADRPFSEVFVTENEVNYLAFPERAGAAIVLGSGYGFASLAEAAWLRGPRLRYWGDLDSHGFAILDQFRAAFPAAESFLMDGETLLAHRALWTSEPKPTKADLGRLTPEERELYDGLRSDRWAASLRLEQERIGFSFVERALAEGGTRFP